MTYRQALELGGQVRKGEKVPTVVYAGAIERAEQNEKVEGEESRIPLLKAYSVFNADQVDSLPGRFHPIVAAPNTPDAAHRSGGGVFPQYRRRFTPRRRSGILSACCRLYSNAGL